MTDRPQRILIISDAWEPQVNGVVRTYQFLQQELLARGHAVRVIGPHEFPLTVPMPGYAEIRLAIRPKRRLYQWMDEFQPTILHIATEGPLGWAARDWARDRGYVFTTTYHTHFPAYIAKRLTWARVLSRFGADMTTRYLRRFHAPASKILVSTPTLARELANSGFKNPTHLMTRGVDTNVFHPNGPRAALPDHLRRPVALYVGRVAIEKNIRAFLDMPWAGGKVVVGDGPLRTGFMAQYTDVHFAGLRTGAELAAYYRSADVFVFPSMTDTFGMVLIEAMACGLPIAAYPVPGPQDIVTAPILGVLDNDLAVAAHGALGCGSTVDRVDHVRRHYTWSLATDQFLAAQTEG